MSNIDIQTVQAVADLKVGYTLGHADVEFIQQMALDAVTLQDELEAKDKQITELNRANSMLVAKIEPMDRRIAELEARKVTVKLPDCHHERFWDARGEEFNPVEYKFACIEMWREELEAAGFSNYEIKHLRGE